MYDEKQAANFNVAACACQFCIEVGLPRQKKKSRGSGRGRDTSPTAEEILVLMEEAAAPLQPREILRRLQRPDSALQALQRTLEELERAGRVLRNRRDAYLLIRHTDLITGRVQGHRDGFGFLVPDERGEQADIYLSARQMRGLMDGDRAVVRISRFDHLGRPAGSLVEVLQRAHRRIVGRLARESGIYFVIPDNPRLSNDVLLAPDGVGDARTGQIVIVEIEEYPSEDRHALGRVVEVLGEVDRPGVEIDMAIHAYDLPREWPAPVQAFTRRLPRRVSTRDKAEREELRKLPLVTIDGADARDFDDAVFCEPAGEGWRLLVAIADVSHYVQSGSVLDREALDRGTSVYFPDRVLPMLPEALSNELCSLKPRVDRLCMVCEMQVSPAGVVKKSRFFRAVMRSAERLIYEDVSDWLEGRGSVSMPRRLHEPLRHLLGVFESLSAARRRRGALDFDVAENRIVLDEQGNISDIRPYERRVAHRIIEECMVAANVEAAKFLRSHRLPTLYRVHEPPSGDKLEELRGFLDAVGVKLARGKVLKPLDLQHLMQRLHEREVDPEVVDSVVLRAMSQAVYQPRNVGHFGLGLAAYAHFTSPIRRYPDLLVHRGIAQILEQGGTRGFAYSAGDMEHLGSHCSERERRADDATRQAVDRLKCAYMQDKVGSVYDAVVTAVTAFGLFVRLSELHVEGLVHVSSLGSDYFVHESATQRLVGRSSGQTFGLMDRLQVRLIRVSVEDRKIDFELHEPPRKNPRRRRRRRR